MTPRAMRDTMPSPGLVEKTLDEHASSLLRLARRYSVCADDAQDAYQRAIEIFLRRADSVEPETAASWLRTVVKHEALAVRRSRLRVVGPEEVDPDLREDTTEPSPDERVFTAELAARSAEAFARLKPQEARALWLKAQGHSYAEIGRLCGWSYTKVNRCITEGRRAFLDRYAGIESGAECRRWAHVLSAMADGEATAAQLADARPHLRNCPACRATLRDFHDVPREIGLLAPTVIAGGAGPLHSAWSAVRDFLAALGTRGPAGSEVAGAAAVGGGGTLAASGAKVAALCASVSIAAGGAYCIDHSGLRATKDGLARRTNDGAVQTSRLIPGSALRDPVADRRPRRASSAELASKRRQPPSASQRGKRSDEPTEQPEPSPTATPSGQGPASSRADSGFTFESGDSGGSPPPAQPASQPQTSQEQRPSGEFDGGGFE
jgi:RNA polymerase sigma factor (sigma-70 family)